MWKLVTRGIRATLEQRTCCTNTYSQSTSKDNAKHKAKTKRTCQQRFIAPVFASCDKVFSGSTKTAGAKDKEHNSKWNTNYSWPEAFGWSSVLAAGWVVCQTFCLRDKIFKRDSNKNLTNRLFYYAKSSHILAHILNIQPKHILPVTNCVGNSNKSCDLKDPERSEERQFGPITVEEALQEAADEFANAHKVIVGEFELRYGIKALQEKRYKDALTHFSAGAKVSSPGSMFNLGLCYELGIGTLADQGKAAKHYHDAAAYDHADALYNLGVFHAQGRGGLSIDIDTARICFDRAAKLGQVEAQRALDMENHEAQSTDNDICIMPYLRSTGLQKNATDNPLSKLIEASLNPTAFVAKFTLVRP